MRFFKGAWQGRLRILLVFTVLYSEMVFSERMLSEGAAPKNIILLIGDGMGYEVLRAGGLYQFGDAYRSTPKHQFVFENFQYQGRLDTRSLSSYDALNPEPTDSAAAASAIATGKRVLNGAISADKTGEALETLLEFFQAQGKSVALVTSAKLTDATPAAFGAHAPSRKDTRDIALDYITQTKPHVLLGGGLTGVDKETAKKHGFLMLEDEAVLVKEIKKETRHQYIIGAFAKRDLMPEGVVNAQDFYQTKPHLNELALYALNLIKKDPEGFFIMIEGALIDKSLHRGEIELSIYEMVEFANTVSKVMEWLDKQSAAIRDNTLVVVVADHETGGLRLIRHSDKAGDMPLMEITTTTMEPPPPGYKVFHHHTSQEVPVYATGPNADQVPKARHLVDLYWILKGEQLK